MLENYALLYDVVIDKSPPTSGNTLPCPRQFPPIIFACTLLCFDFDFDYVHEQHVLDVSATSFD